MPVPTTEALEEEQGIGVSYDTSFDYGEFSEPPETITLETASVAAFGQNTSVFAGPIQVGVESATLSLSAVSNTEVFTVPTQVTVESTTLSLSSIDSLSVALSGFNSEKIFGRVDAEEDILGKI